MVPLNSFATGIVADIIRRQPASPARTTFAWQLAVGPVLARKAVVSLQDGLLVVRVRDAQWGAELESSSATILGRMRHLLGAAQVRGVEIR